MLAVAAIVAFLTVVRTEYASLLLAFFVAAVFPDLDSKNSTVRRSASIIVPAILSFFAVFETNANMETRASAGIIVLLASYMLIESLPLSHRGRRSLHRTLPMLLVSAAVGFVVWAMFKAPDIWLLFMAALLGYATHMASDKLLN